MLIKHKSLWIVLPILKMSSFRREKEKYEIYAKFITVNEYLHSFDYTAFLSIVQARDKTKFPVFLP